jgi:type II secretory pathway pseudopilin PulG
MVRRSPAGDLGYAMAALLVGMSVMGIVLGMALPSWRTFIQREREAELIFRGEQYAQAIARFQGRTGGFPTALDALEKGKFIRKLYKDPITNGDFQPVFLGQIGPVTPPATGPARGGQTPAARGSIPAAGRGPGQPAGQPLGRAGQPFGGAGQPFGGAGQPLGRAGQTGPTGAGPIVGVVSSSAAASMRLYNGRGKYNEWLFVSTAATQQPGAPTGAQTPGMGPGGRGRGPDPAGTGRGREGGRGRGVTPDGRGRGGFSPSPFGPPPGTGGRGGVPNPSMPGRGRL